MSNYHIHQGLNHVGSYQVSGIPFIYKATASVTVETIQFPTVSKTVCVENLGAINPLVVSFPSNPSTSISIPAGDKIELSIKSGAVIVTSTSGTDYQIYASLTSINRARIEGIIL